MNFQHPQKLKGTRLRSLKIITPVKCLILPITIVKLCDQRKESFIVDIKESCQWGVNIYKKTVLWNDVFNYSGIHWYTAFFNRGCCNGLGQLVSYYLKFKPFRTAQKAILASNTKERNFKGVTCLELLIVTVGQTFFRDMIGWHRTSSNLSMPGMLSFTIGTESQGLLTPLQLKW